VRFIEYMPLDAQDEWSDDSVVRCEEIVERVGRHFPLEPVARTSAPATRFRYLDGGGEIGVVASVSEAFCGTCDRVRMTADGQFRNCLFATEELDLRELLRSGADDDALAAAISGNVGEKAAGHLIGKVNFIRPARSMSQIGG
jgi:cyclic pyranopterin phosphate synthase